MAAIMMTLLYSIQLENAKESVCGVPVYHSMFCAINLFTNQQMCLSQNCKGMLRGYYGSLPSNCNFCLGEVTLDNQHI